MCLLNVVNNVALTVFCGSENNINQGRYHEETLYLLGGYVAEICTTKRFEFT